MTRHRLLVIPQWIAAVTTGLGVLSFTGWLLASPALARLLLAGPPLKPNGALCLILLGAALFLLARAHTHDDKSLFTAGQTLALLGAVIGAVTLIEHWTNAGIAFDSVFLREGMIVRPRVFDVRMSKLSSFTIVLLGTGLAIGRGNNKKYSLFGDFTFLVTAMLTLIGLLAAAYGALPVDGLGHPLQVPLPAVTLTFALAIGAVLLRPESPVLQPFVSGGAGGALIARMLPFVLIVPIALGALHITQMLSPENAAMQAALSSAITAIIFSIVVWKAADELNKLDAQRQALDRERGALAVRTERDAELRVITERQRQTEAFFSSALNSAPLGFIFWDRKLRIIRLNSLLAGWNGRDPRAYVGKRVEDVAPQFAQQLTPVLQSILETGQPRSNVEILRNSTIEPEVKRLNGMFYPVSKSSGEVIGIVAIISDVTREHAREAALLETNERYRYVAKATNDAVWDWDVATNTLVWNESVYSLFGYSPSEVQNDLTWWENRIHPDDRAQVVESFHQAVEDGSEIWETSYRFRNGDGSYSNVVDRGYIIRDSEGHARRAIGAMSDRTMQTALEESLRNSQKMDAVGRLSAGVAHDFNNVLAVIGVSADLLLSSFGVDAEQRREVEEIKKAAQRGGRLTKQLLAFTRQQMLSAVPLDLNAALDEMLGMLHRLVTDKVELAVVREPKLRIIKADRGQMEQIALNLVLNARDAMPDGGVVLIETANFSGSIPCVPGMAKGDFVTLSVSDTGVGIPSEITGRIFDPFFTTKDVGQGTGLGLATVQAIIKQSGGEICVESQLGKGSRFTAYFPALAGVQAGPESPAPSPRSDPAVTAKQTILLVEDDDALRSSVARILTRAGYDVLTAEHGARALGVGNAHPGRIALVLTDARMPVMGGAELVRKIREAGIDTRVLVMSGYTEEIETGMVDGGTVPFIEKPFSSEMLLEKIRTIIST